MGLYANEDFLKVLTFPLLLGKTEEVLKGPSSIVISERVAIDLFGSVDKAIGQTLRYMDRDDFSVSGVLANVPDHSSLRFDYIINWQIFRRQRSCVYLQTFMSDKGWLLNVSVNNHRAL
ncbi:ABC transporter permease [Flavitalea sp.]